MKSINSIVYYSISGYRLNATLLNRVALLMAKLKGKKLRNFIVFVDCYLWQPCAQNQLALDGRRYHIQSIRQNAFYQSHDAQFTQHSSSWKSTTPLKATILSQANVYNLMCYVYPTIQLQLALNGQCKIILSYID